ncbi:MAG: VWA domain-containing protein [Candidatus Aminicenantes bacterium]|nr:VWA domain-containing protein [Candidatus Aminicenantes bacterium]
METRKLNKLTLILFLSIWILFLSLYGFQEQQKLFPPEKHEVEVRLVLVDVIVTKDGKFVKDLTKDDFEVYEDGKKVPINSFELMSFEERELKIVEEKAERKRPAPQKRKLVVIFDAINSWRREIKLESKKIIDELFSLIKLGHEVMILQLHRRKGLEILQPFTTDEDLIRKAVEKASGNIWKLGMDADEVPPKFVADPERYRKLTRLEYLYLERRRFQDTIGGLLAAFNMVRNLPGRKSILLISAGIPDLSPPDMLRYPLGNIRLFDPFNILEKKNFKEGEEVIRELISFANAQNISIYTLDSDIYVKHLFSGTTAERYQKYEIAPFVIRGGDKIRKVQNLSWISKDTGASHLRGADKFDNFRQVISTDLKYYYQLTYYPRRKEADDKYHKLKIEVKRRGAKARFRKGYTDYSREEANKMQLITAFYNPALCKQLPFEGEFIPFFTKSGKYEPWMNIALPAKELFRDRFVDYARKKFNLHIWITDKKSGEKGYGGQINLPFNINPSFMEFIKNIDYLSFHFKGPELTFKHNEYHTVFALVDPQTNEIGTWESMLSLPDFKKSKEGAFINCVLGQITSNPKKQAKSFSLSKQDGSLEYGQIKFLPRITNQFANREEASVFLQIYLPQGKKEIQPEFLIKGEDSLLRPLSGVVSAESWNKKSKVWSAIFKLDLKSATLGENSLYIEIPLSDEGAVLSNELKLTILR